MSDNPYSPPASKLADPIDREPGSPVKAVLLGAAVDIGGSLAMSMVLGIVVAVMMSGVAPAQMGAELAAMAGTSPYKVIAMVLGTAMSVLAGFTCARIARRRDDKLAFILGAISVTAGLLFAGDWSSPGMLALNAVLTFGAVLAGARLGRPKAAAGA